MSKRQYFSFYLGEQLYGIDILLVREIIKNFDITPVELAPENVYGLINLRGQIVTVIAPSVSLWKKKTVVPSSTCIVLKSNSELSRIQISSTLEGRPEDELAGLLIDGTHDVYDIETSDIELPPPNMKDIESNNLSGVVKLEGSLMMLLNVQEILNGNGKEM
ncbi:MAG: chemotaxis protein CheW [Nitrospinota bacterium]